jgi:signal transduction histidine kinase
MMNVVWDNSSDVIGISVKGPSGIVTTMLSPTYLKLYYDSHDVKEHGSSTNAITFDLDSKYFENKVFEGSITASNICSVDFSEFTGNSRGEGSDHNFKGESRIVKEDMTSICELLLEAWKSNKYNDILTKSLTQRKGKNIVSTYCEATVTRVEDNALMIVIRDISERQKRFEAEKQVVSESTARQKDAAANRFTRHEIKNGILSAIGLCDSLREVLQTAAVQKRELKAVAEAVSTIDSGYVPENNDITRCINELDKTLHEILETVLSEAMARDVIHEVYEPKLECLDLTKLLMSTMNVSASISNQIRFPIVTFPGNFPKIAMDPLLMKCIHRNAISNACKYGKIGGTVTTEVYFNEDLGLLRMNVINLPGEHHQEIVDIGPLVSDMVFKPRFRLSMHSTSEPLQHMASHSAGDGAWIMYKCAKTLGGTCDIKVRHNSS